jgi:thiamine-phosphate diphosphorylase
VGERKGGRGGGSAAVTRSRLLPRLHLVTDDRVARGVDFFATAGELLEAGGERVALHLRAPGAGGRWLFETASALRPLARRTGSLLIVNDRVDVALACGADGVQLGRRSLSVEDARPLMGGDLRIGASVHTAAEAEEALGQGADFVLAGTLYASVSHPGRSGTGPGWIGRIEGGGGRVIGIGGVTVNRVGELLTVGAHGAAVVSGVWNAERPRDALLRYLEALYDRKGN